MKTAKTYKWIAIGLFCLLLIRFGRGVFATGDSAYEQIRRFITVLNAVREYYVEKVSPRKLVDGAIIGMLEQLDPHSIYLSPKQVQQFKEEFEGDFSGIGIEFIIRDNYPVVVTPIPNTPAERLGIRPGDKILKINGMSCFGLKENELRYQLRGEIGTIVRLTIQRTGMAEPLEFIISRDRIPVHSVQTYFMLNHKIGYLHLSRFSKTTDEEVEHALCDLENQGMKKLIFDLRFNSGGYLEQAVKVADKFLSGGKKIVYTRGRVATINEEYYSTSYHTHPNYPLVILINHGTASAAEVVAGAIQDWDRGVIVGETSFGKGLVQNQIPLNDGSAIRITVGRYYTPSGRLIQRPFDHNVTKYYTTTVENTKVAGHQRRVFSTFSGRKVYGGGGITPDVKIQSPKITTTTAKLIANRSFFEFANQYAPSIKKKYSSFKDFVQFSKLDNILLQQFLLFLENKHYSFNYKEIIADKAYILAEIKSEVARQLWGSNAYFKIRVLNDLQVKKALTAFPLAEKLAALESGR